MTTLYEYQQEDVDKIALLDAGAIGSEMGTGKTYEGIALFKRWSPTSAMPSLEPKLPSLVVAPLNTHKSWLNKFKEFAPEVRVMRIDRKDRDGFIFSMLNHDADVYLIHWQALHLMPYLQKFKYDVIIGDEVHRISNREAKVTAAFKSLKCNKKLGMSGTMTGDKPDKLWSILNWLYPKDFSSYWGFRQDYIIESVGDGGYRSIIGVKNTDHLHKRLDPFFVRHLKKAKCCEHHAEGVMHWLPDKTYDTIEVVLNPKQRRIYDQMEQQMVTWLGEHEDTPLTASVVIAQLTRLSQMALATPKLVPHVIKKENPLFYLDPDNEPEFYEETEIRVQLESPSTKIDAVQELILDNPGKPFLVFSSSRQACYLAEEQLEKAGIKCRVLSGNTPQHKREAMIEDFQTGEFQVFIAVIAAASEGIDGLQNVCDTLIFLDRSWSTLENKQAEDRLHRGGQKNAVQIIDVIAENTVDAGRLQRLEMKWKWIRQMLGDVKPQSELRETT